MQAKFPKANHQWLDHFHDLLSRAYRPPSGSVQFHIPVTCIGDRLATRAAVVNPSTTEDIIFDLALEICQSDHHTSCFVPTKALSSRLSKRDVASVESMMPVTSRD